MKLRQTLLLCGFGSAALCVLMIAMLIFTVGRVSEAREQRRGVRLVEQQLDALATDLFEFGLVGLDEGRFAALVEASERVDETIRASAHLSNGLGDSYYEYTAQVARYAMSLGHAGPGAFSDEAAQLERREDMIASLRQLRGKLDEFSSSSQRAVDLAQDRVLFIAVGLLVLLVAMTLGLTTRVVRRVLRPTRALKAAMEEMDHGRWPVEVDVEINDELGELAATFNSMAIGKRESEHELRVMHEELEARVVSRTSALAEVNRALEQEIEERRRTEGLLRASEERFRRFYEESPLGIALVSKGSYFQTVNQALAKILGRSEREIEGRSVLRFTADERAADLLEESRAAFRSGAGAYSAETTIARPDGEPRRVSLVAATVRDQRGEVNYGLLMVEDITERKRTEELLLENERFVATGRMAARIAHEINNPLAGIKNAFRLVKAAVPSDHEYSRYVPRIDNEIDRVARIVRQMYELYRPPAENVVEFRADEAISDVVALMSAGERSEGESQIVLDVSRARAKVGLVEGLLRQVLYNLIQNAIEHSPGGTPVQVSASIVDDTLEILVTDEGEGIDAHKSGRIFEAFYTTKEGRDGSGLGLGLSITLRAVEAMEGTLTFDSELGAGSVFRVRLPVQSRETVGSG